MLKTQFVVGCNSFTTSYVVLEVDLALPQKALLHTKEAIRAWDTRRECEMGYVEGEGSWDVLFSLSPAGLDQTISTKPLSLQTRSVENVIIPPITASSVYRTPTNKGAEEEEEEDYQEYISNVFEWIGMACLGSQRCATC